MDGHRFCRIVAWTVLGMVITALSIIGIHTAVYWLLHNVVVVNGPVTTPNTLNLRDVATTTTTSYQGVDDGLVLEGEHARISPRYSLTAELQGELEELRMEDRELAASWEEELIMGQGEAVEDDDMPLWRRSEEDSVESRDAGGQDEGDGVQDLPPLPKEPIRLPPLLPTRIPAQPKLPELPVPVPTDLPKLPILPIPLPTKLPDLPPLPPLPPIIPTDLPTRPLPTPNPPPVKKPNPPGFKLPGFINVPAKLLRIIMDAIFRMASTIGLPSEVRDVLMFMYHVLQRITGGSSLPHPGLPVPIPTSKGRGLLPRPTLHPPRAPGAVEESELAQLGMDGVASGFVSVTRRSVDGAAEAGMEAAAAPTPYSYDEEQDDEEENEDGSVDAMRKKPLTGKMRRDLLSMAAFEFTREIADKGDDDEEGGVDGLITVPACMAVFELLLRHTEAWLGPPSSKGRKQKGYEIDDGLVEALQEDEAWGLIDEVYF